MENSSIVKQLAALVVCAVAGALLGVAVVAGALLGVAVVAADLFVSGEAWFYGQPVVTQNGGVVVQIEERGCGVEVWGQPGPFCDNGLRDGIPHGVKA